MVRSGRAAQSITYSPAYLASLLACVFLVACGGDGPSVTDGGVDGAVVDGAVVDGAVVDGGFDGFVPVDAFFEDAGEGGDAGFDSGAELDGGDGDAGGDAAVEPVPGFGAIVGPCGLVPSEIDAVSPSFYVVRFDFADDAYDASDLPELTEGAQEILTAPNAGGSSRVSEAFAYEVLERCERAMSLVANETDVTYEEPSKKTDFVALFHENVGVSVTRAFSFPPDSPYPLSEAQRVIGGKLDDILDSTANVIAPTWDKQILVVMAWDEPSADRVREAWDGFTPERRADTIVYVVITDGADGPVYNR